MTRKQTGADGLDVFDKTIQTTNIWLDEISAEIGGDRRQGYHALMAVLHALRDQLPLDESAQLSAQLPILIRGLYFHAWDPSDQYQPSGVRKADDFLALVQAELMDIRPVSPENACRAVFHALERHVSEGELQQIRAALPQNVRTIWPDDVVEPAHRKQNTDNRISER